MKVTYNDLDDILLIELSPEKIVRNVSYDWHVQAGLSARRLTDISILDIKKVRALAAPKCPRICSDIYPTRVGIDVR